MPQLTQNHIHWHTHRLSPHQQPPPTPQRPRPAISAISSASYSFAAAAGPDPLQPVLHHRPQPLARRVRSGGGGGEHARDQAGSVLPRIVAHKHPRRRRAGGGEEPAGGGEEPAGDEGDAGGVGLGGEVGWQWRRRARGLVVVEYGEVDVRYLE
jgi:hypothetical protein